MQHRVAGDRMIDVAQIGVARPAEHPVRQHRSLRPAGGAGGVEQPGKVIAAARHNGDRIAREQRLVLA